VIAIIVLIYMVYSLRKTHNNCPSCGVDVKPETDKSLIRYVISTSNLDLPEYPL